MTRRIWVGGLHAATAALSPECRGRCVQLLLSRKRGGADSKALLALARSADVEPRFVSRAELSAAAGRADAQGVAAEVALDALEAESWDAVRPSTPDPLVIALDEIQDPQNLGAILRSAHALGAAAVVLGAHRSAPLSAAAVQASAGAALVVPVVRLPNIKHALRAMQAEGYRLWAAAMDGEPAWSVDMTGPTAVVIGNEGAGVRPSVAQLCDGGVAVPMRADFDSLNASVAAGVILYEARRQRAIA